MTGFTAISAQNGWIMAVTGALIVMTGLTVLAAIISQLHRVIALFERKPGGNHALPATAQPRKAPPDDFLNDPPAAAGFYQVLTADLGEEFLLADMFAILKKEGNTHPHMTLKSLRENGYLLPLGDGRFKWKS